MRLREWPPSRQIEGGTAVFRRRRIIGVEADTQGIQLPDALGAAGDHLAHHIRVADAIPGVEGILNMQVERIPDVENRGDAPLGQIGVAVHRLFFGDDGNGPVIGHLEGVHQTGDAAADNQEVCLCVHVVSQ